MLTLGETSTLDYRGLILVHAAPRLEHDGVRRIIDFMRSNRDGFDSIEHVQGAISTYNPRRQVPRSLQGLHKNFRQDTKVSLYWHWAPAFLDHAVTPDGDTDMFDSARLNKAARGFNIPVLLIRGFQSDVLSDQGTEELLTLLPHSYYHVLDQADQIMPGDHNNILTNTVLDFINNLDGINAAPSSTLYERKTL